MKNSSKINYMVLRESLAKHRGDTDKAKKTEGNNCRHNRKLKDGNIITLYLLASLI